MKTFLFFQPSLDGHFLEYLHHEYMAAIQKQTDRFVFVVPDNFEARSKCLTWPASTNVSFRFLVEYELSKLNHSSLFTRSLSQSRIIRRYCKQYNADICFLNDLVNAMPFVVLFVPKGCRISGILYGISKWRNEHFSVKRFMEEKLLYRIYSNTFFFSNVFLLNDLESPNYYNRLFHTTTFSYIPDPINVNADYVPKENLRDKLDINPTDEVYLQLVVQQRKHPFEILDAIRKLSDEQLSNKVFIFTGIIEERICERFLKEVDDLRQRVRIILKTGRVPYETIYDLFNISDYCFVLYDNTNMSSGVLGYAAYFHTKVIGVNKGLLGFLINKYRLGICVDEIKQEEISRAILEVMDCPSVSSEYIENNTIDKFTETIFNC